MTRAGSRIERTRDKYRRSVATQVDRREFREGILFEGRWWTPDELHAKCAARMAQVDRLPRELRDRLNSDGRL
jgi:hypothetical protein